ncbi:MAG: hypothetical protein P4L57_08880 [Rhizomicrobium sp.]|nr:hypothetical protein [Rhizomicrobium sp.]
MTKQNSVSNGPNGEADRAAEKRVWQTPMVILGSITQDTATNQNIVIHDTIHNSGS